jgi:hypothetical protein
MTQHTDGHLGSRRSRLRAGAVALAWLAVGSMQGQARAEEPQQTAPPASSNNSTVAALTYGGFATAGVGVLVGSVVGILAISKTSQLKSDCGGTVCPADRANDISSAKNLAGLSTVSFAIALVGVAVGVNGMILWSNTPGKQPAETSAVRIRPVLGLGSAGLEGSF